MTLGAAGLLGALATLHLVVALVIFVPSALAALLRRARRTPPRTASAWRQPVRVTALKPLRGLDPSLEENLESFAALTVADALEVLLLVDAEGDEALSVARRLAHRHPERFRVVVGTDSSCANPKVASLAFGLRHATHEFIWVTDSNVQTSNEHLGSQLDTWCAAQATGRRPTLIHAPLAAIGGTGLGASFERIHLASYNNPAAEISLLGGVHAVVGKSLLWHRDDLEAVGGLTAFGGASGEDFLMGRAFQRVGTVRSASFATKQVLGPVTATDFFRRQQRWASVRRRMAFFIFLGLEPLTHFALAFAWLALGLVRWEFVAAAYATKLVLDAWLVRAFAGSVRLLDVLLVPVKDVVMWAAWVGAFFKADVQWRGRTLNISGKTYLAQPPTSPAASAAPEAQLARASSQGTSSANEPQ